MIYLPNKNLYLDMQKIFSYNKLNQLGCPVLKSVLLEENELLDFEKVEKIKKYLKSDFCTIRYQYTCPNNHPVIGGNRISITKEEINRKKVKGARAWLLEDVERDKNLYGFSIIVNKNISTVVEIVGKGFDGSDLNRGNMNPHQIIYFDNPIREGYYGEWWKFIRMDICSQYEFNLSKQIRSEKLKKIKYQFDEASIFDENYKPIPFSVIEEIIAYISLLQDVKYDDFVVAGSVLDNGKIIFWDIHDKREKVKLYTKKEVREMNEELTGCIFCAENRFFYHKKIGLRYDNAIIYEDENIYITPDISPVTLGHYLIITKEHIHGYANASDDILKSLMNAIEFLKKKVYKRNDVTIFEHGAIVEGKAGASVDHAHLHVIPGYYNLTKHVDKSDVYTEKKKFSVSTLKSLADKHPYLWISNEEKSYLYIVDKLPSQYLREIFMKSKPSEYTYNWRKEYDNDKSLKMYNQTLNLYSNNEISLN